jgi:hypothetical protein
MVRQNRTMERELRILLNFRKEHRIAALDFSSFVFDFNRLYVALLRRQDGYAENRRQPPFVRDRFRVPKPYQLEISKVRFESPGFIEFLPQAATAVVGGVGLIWVLLQIIERAQMWPLQKRKLQLEIKKLERETSDLRQPSFEQILAALKSPAVQSAVRQLDQNPIKPSDLTVKIKRTVRTTLR